MNAPQYRVRLLAHAVVVYNGRSYALASKCMDALDYDRILERRERDGWQTVISVERGAC